MFDWSDTRTQTQEPESVSSLGMFNWKLISGANIPRDETGSCVYVRVSDQLNMPSLGPGMIIGQNYTEPYFQSNLLSLVAMIWELLQPAAAMLGKCRAGMPEVQKVMLLAVSSLSIYTPIGGFVTDWLWVSNTELSPLKKLMLNHLKSINFQPYLRPISRGRN